MLRTHNIFVLSIEELICNKVLKTVLRKINEVIPKTEWVKRPLSIF